MPLVDHSAVEDILYEAVNTILRPACDNMANIAISEKGPNDFLTDTDLAMEEFLKSRLTTLLPSETLGEEETTKDPSILKQRLKSDKPVWIIDPIDGTYNFIHQSGGFGPMVALLHKGKITGAWIYNINNPRGILSLENTAPVEANLASVPRGIVGSRVIDIFKKANKADNFIFLNDYIMSCEFYEQLLNGDIDFCILHMTNPWDHAGGIAMLRKAGMCALQWDGSPAIYDDINWGIIVAKDEMLAKKLFLEIVKPTLQSNVPDFMRHKNPRI